MRSVGINFYFCFTQGTSCISWGTSFLYPGLCVIISDISNLKLLSKILVARGQCIVPGEDSFDTMHTLSSVWSRERESVKAKLQSESSEILGLIKSVFKCKYLLHPPAKPRCRL